MQRMLISSQDDKHRKHSCEINADIAEVLNQNTQADKEGSGWHRWLQRSWNFAPVSAGPAPVPG